MSEPTYQLGAFIDSIRSCASAEHPDVFPPHIDLVQLTVAQLAQLALAGLGNLESYIPADGSEKQA
jgi:hypothetical protein